MDDSSNPIHPLSPLYEERGAADPGPPPPRVDFKDLDPLGKIIIAGVLGLMLFLLFVILRGGKEDMEDNPKMEPRPATLREAGYEYKDGQIRLVNMQKAMEASGLLGTRLYPKDAKYPGSELNDDLHKGDKSD